MLRFARITMSRIVRIATIRTALLTVGGVGGLALGACGGGGSEAGAPTVTVFAAASLTDVLESFASRYRERIGSRVVVNPAASSTLARQIDAGAPADLFCSAHPEWIDYLSERGRLEPGTTVELVQNRLVWVAPPGLGYPLELRPDFDVGAAFRGRLALGDPEHVPAGRYAKQALEALGWWDDLARRVVPALDVRDALRLVALGEARGGIVYATDARAADVMVLGEIPERYTPPVRYGMALVRGRAEGPGRAFWSYLQEPEARALFRQHAFLVPEPVHD